MTVKLLAQWGEFPAGSLFSSTAQTEAALVADKVATTDLAGGVPWNPPKGQPGEIARINERLSFENRPKFSDSFKRADTSAGSIGAGWSVRGVYAGSYPLPAGTDGKITSQAIECPGGLTTYFMRTLTETPKFMQAKISWLDLANGATGYQTFAMICTASSNLIDDMGVHITLSHTTLKIQERITGGAFVDLISPVDISPRLSLADGENILTLEIDAASNSGRVFLNEREYSFSSQNLSSHIGPVIAVEWFQSGGATNRWRGRILGFSAS